MDELARAAYLRRLGLEAAAADEAGLRVLHRAHQHAIPFENLSIHLDEEISLAQDDLLSKLTSRLHFRTGTVCSRLTGEGRVTISGRTLIRTGAEGRTEEKLDDDAALLTAYREHFGIVLDRVP
jgi:arylamine N-acetyltransferase